jgi:uncharacterized membrane protein
MTSFSTLLILTVLGPTVTHTQLKPTLEKHCTKFMDRVVVRKDMPLGNITEMTEAERSLFKGGCKK